MANFKERGLLISDMAESGAENKLGNIKASFVAKGYVNNSDGNNLVATSQSNLCCNLTVNCWKSLRASTTKE